MVDDATINLVARWQAGDQGAASELFERYAEQLTELVQRNLASRFAGRVDPEDVVQSACHSFFAGARAGRYVLEHSGELWRLLAAITLHKLQHQVRRHSASKRTVELEQTFGGDNSLIRIQAVTLAREPSPEDAVVAADILDQATRSLTPLQRRMVELRLQGYNLAEIAAESQRSERTVRRVLDSLREQLNQGLNED